MGAELEQRHTAALARARDVIATKQQGGELPGSNGNVPGVLDVGDLEDAGLIQPGPARPPGSEPTVQQIDSGQYCVVRGDVIGPCFDTAAEAMAALAEVDARAHDDENKRRHRRRRRRKALPMPDPEAGIHMHALVREESKTQNDGRHVHLFLVPAEMIGGEAGELIPYITAEDGAHEHTLGAERAPEMGDDGAHDHAVTLLDGTVVRTNTGGTHNHQTVVAHTAFDGVHKHVLEIGSDIRIESLTGSEFWEVIGMPPQAGNPAAPPATELIKRGLVVPAALVDKLVDGSVGLVVAPERLDIEGERVTLVAGVEAVALATVGKVEELTDADFAKREGDHGIGEALRDALAKGDPLWSEGPLFAWTIADVTKLADSVPLRAFGPGLLIDVEPMPPIIVWKADPPVKTLPGIKTPHAAMLVDRMMNGQPAGLLSLRMAVERGSQPQALLDDAGNVFAIVSQGVAVQHDDIDAVPVELRAGIDPSVLDEFVGKSNVWYLPLDLHVVFDPHIELPTVPEGGRFVREVTLTKDEISDDPITVIEAIDANAIATAETEVLRTFDRQLHVIFERNFAPDAEPRGDIGISAEQVIDAHMLVLQAMIARGQEGPEDDHLALATAAMMAKVHKQAPRAGMSQDQLRAARDARSKEFGIEVVDSGSSLTFPSGFPTKLGQYGDPVNLKFPVDTVARARNARVRFKQNAMTTYDEEKSRAVVHERIVRAELKLGITPSFDEDDALDKLLPAALQRELQKIAKASKSRAVRLLKQDEGDEERYVFGVVLVPDDVDAQGDIYDIKAVRDAAHGFMEFFGGRIKLMHQGQPVEGVKVLETYLTKTEETHGGETLPIGTWLMAVRVQSDELWAAVKAGEFTGFSIGGTAIRESLAA